MHDEGIKDTCFYHPLVASRCKIFGDNISFVLEWPHLDALSIKLTSPTWHVTIVLANDSLSSQAIFQVLQLRCGYSRTHDCSTTSGGV